jgi:hypothetical protein
MKDHVHLGELTGRRPFGAILALGRKGDNGAPVDKDRWHITDTVMDRKDFRRRDGGTVSGEFHAPHPAFAAWTAQRNTADRQVIRVVLEGATWAESVTISRSRQTDAGGKSIPSTLPWCFTTGAGGAKRWSSKGHHQPFACAGDRCPEAQRNKPNGETSPHACRPQVELFGRLTWAGTPWAGVLPEPVVRWRSHGWGSVRGVLGVEEELDRAWRSLVVVSSGASELADAPLSEVLEATGAPPYVVAGLVLELRVTVQSRGGRVYTQVDASTTTPIGEWLASHAERVTRIRDAVEASRVAPPAEPRRIAGPVPSPVPSPAPSPAPSPVVELEAEPVAPPVDPDLTERTARWWAERGVDLRVLTEWVGAPPDAWTAEHYAVLRQRAREYVGGAK